jgi:photosystem II stability/assembly factor-like uncharacterized protein
MVPIHKKIYLRMLLIGISLGVSRIAAEATWVPIGPEGGSAYNVVQHPTQPQVLYITVGSAQSSLYKSTDKGALWNKLYVFNRQIYALAISPKNANELYAGSNSQFYRSTDGGATWNTAYTFTGDFHEVIPDSMDSNVLHACGTSYPKGQKDSYSVTYFKSTDRGSTWSAKPASTARGNGMALCVDPHNSNLVFVCGGGKDKTTAQLFRTTDGGATWSDMTGSIEGNIADILMDSRAEKRVYAATNAGVYRSTDTGETWTKNNGFVLGETLAFDRKNELLYLGAVKQIYRSTDGGANWKYYPIEYAGGGWVNSILVDPTHSSTVYAGSYAGFFYSTDSGLSWSVSNAGILASNITTVTSPPGNPEVLYAAQESGYLFKTQNALAKPSAPQSIAWQKFYQVPNCNSFSVKTILFDPSRPNTLYLYKEYG